VQNGWDVFFGGGGSDTIYVAPKSGYSWTAVMIGNNGLNSVESISFNTSGLKPIYFADNVSFADVVSMNSDAKIYGRGNDNTFSGGTLGEYVEGDAGNDTLNGYGGNDTLYGDTFDNPWAVSYSAAGNDILNGGTGNDTLFGQGGNDILNGGSGTNSLTGGAGADSFRFNDFNDHSTITDFQLGVDKVQIDTSIASDFASLTIIDVGGTAVVTTGNVEITLTGIAAANLSSANFDFGLFA
jgi:Ca2+-binding RTX toxin-like protein